MAVQEQTPYIEYTANGIATSFALGFDCESKDHLVVTKNDVESPPNEWSLISGAVVFTTAPLNGVLIVIQRNTPLSRSADYQSYNNSFRPESVNKDFDWVWWKLQEIWVQITLLWAFARSATQDLWDDLNNEIKNRIEADLAIRSWVTILLNNIVDSGLVSAIAVTTVESVNDLQYLLKWEGRTIYVKSYHAGLSMGGGIFTYSSSKALQNDGGVILNGWVRINYDYITPLMFGAKGDVNYDDRPAFQSSVYYLHSQKGGVLIIPRPPVEYRWKSYDATDSACLVIPAPTSGIYIDPICIYGLGNLIQIKVDLGSGVTIDSSILLKGGGLYKKIENISVWGGKDKDTKNCNYVLRGDTAAYPNLTIRDCQFYVANEDCLKIQTYVSVFDKVQTAYSKRGIVVDGGGNPQTSVTLNSCYPLNHTHNGYYFFQTTYCTFNSCAADHIINDTGDGYEAYPYYIDIARGVTFNGCGAESSTRILKVRSAQGLTINGLMTLSIGDNDNPPDTLMRIDGGASTVISGLWNQNPKAFTYKLTLGNAISAESVTVLDQSLEPKEVSYLSNFRFENPIRFLMNDFSRKTQDNTLTNTGNAATNATNFSNLAQLAWNTELLHDNIIRFPSGDFPINATVYLSNLKTRGGGRIRLIGHADGTSRIVLQGAGGVAFGIPNQLSEMTYTVENLNLYLSATLDATNKGVTFYKANAVFTTGKITSDNGSRQYASNFGSKVTLDANSYIATSLYGSLEVNYSYKATTAPTSSTRLPIGTMFKASDPNATRIGWINTVDNGATWQAI